MSYGLVLQTMKFHKKKIMLIIWTQLGLKNTNTEPNEMLLQCSYSGKFPALSIFSSAGWRWRYPVGGQEPLPLKVAPIQPSVTAAFHLQSRRDSDCQMWELTTNLHWRTYTLHRLFAVNRMIAGILAPYTQLVSCIYHTLSFQESCTPLWKSTII